MSQNDLTELESINQLLESDEFKAYSALPELDNSSTTIPILQDIVSGATTAANPDSPLQDDSLLEDVSAFFNEAPVQNKNANTAKTVSTVEPQSATPKSAEPKPAEPKQPTADSQPNLTQQNPSQSQIGSNELNTTQTAASFLPNDILEKLQSSQEKSQQIIEEMSNFTTSPLPPPLFSGISSADLALEEKLMAEAERILQDVVDEFVPTIEAELRNRLQTEMKFILSDVVESKVREALKMSD